MWKVTGEYVPCLTWWRYDQAIKFLISQSETIGTFFVLISSKDWSISKLNDWLIHFLHGYRLLSSLHARMRNNRSNLKCDLFVNHLSETNLCEYCNVPENAYHFSFITGIISCSLMPFQNPKWRLFSKWPHFSITIWFWS